MKDFFTIGFKINFFTNFKKIKNKLELKKDLKLIRKITLDRLLNYIEIKKYKIDKFKFLKDKKIYKLKMTIGYLNEIKKFNCIIPLAKNGIEKTFGFYSNNKFINDNKEHILERFDFYFEAFNYCSAQPRKKLISDLNKFLFWIDSNNFYYLKQIDQIDYKNLWRL